MKRGIVKYYPIFLNLGGKECVVIGGGQVAWRKVKTLLKSGAIVEVISPVLCAGLTKLAAKQRIRTIERPYEEGDIQGVFLAIAATDDAKINLRIAEEAKISRVPVNIADDAAGSDFIIPSSIRRGDITIAISTSGKSPALARKIRAELEEEFGEEYNLLASLVEEVRRELKLRHLKISNDSWQKALDLNILVELLKKGEREKARETLRNNLGLSYEK